MTARRVVKITPNDNADLPLGICNGIIVGTAGIATINDGEGVTATGVPLPVGFLDIQVKRLFATGLTAANIWAMY